MVTHRDPAVATRAVDELVAAAAEHGIELLAEPVEAEKHPALERAAEVVEHGGGSGAAGGADAAIVLAGDGTLMRVLASVQPGTPVLGVNFGMLGFLSGASHDQLAHAVDRLAAGRYRTTELPSLDVDLAGRGRATAINDVVASGQTTGRVNEVGWRVTSIGGSGKRFVDEMGTVACDGMVIATPVGSTAYNLSNGGPVLAWRVQGTVVSFVAPHTLAARPLVLAPEDQVEIEHMGRGAPLVVLADGNRVGSLKPGEVLRVRRGARRSLLAFVDDDSFYSRYRDNFAVQMQFTGPRVRRSDERAVAPAAGEDA